MISQEIPSQSLQECGDSEKGAGINRGHYWAAGWWGKSQRKEKESGATWSDSQEANNWVYWGRYTKSLNSFLSHCVVSFQYWCLPYLNIKLYYHNYIFGKCPWVYIIRHYGTRHFGIRHSGNNSQFTRTLLSCLVVLYMLSESKVFRSVKEPQTFTPTPAWHWQCNPVHRTWSRVVQYFTHKQSNTNRRLVKLLENSHGLFSETKFITIEYFNVWCKNTQVMHYSTKSIHVGVGAGRRKSEGGQLPPSLFK